MDLQNNTILKSLHFANTFNEIADEKTFVAFLKLGIHDKAQLFDELTNIFNFPDNYFGRNFDALSDCLSDFYGINQKRIILIHRDLPFLEVRDLKIYLNVLLDAIEDWKEWALNPRSIELPSHEFEVIFPVATKTIIKELIS